MASAVRAVFILGLLLCLCLLGGVNAGGGGGHGHDSSSSSDCSSSSEPSVSVPSSNVESSSSGGVVIPPSSSSSTGGSDSGSDCSSSEPSVPSSNQESSSTGSVTPPSSSSSSGSDDSSSSDCGSSSEPSVPSSNQESSSSSGTVTPPSSSSSSTGGSDCGSDSGSEPSTGGNEEGSSSSSSSSGGSVTPPDSSSSGSGSGNEDCQRGTYSDNGFAPCRQCANNTYANIRETSCTPCPANMHAPVGAASLTECMCDEGYTSQWASGGPCYPVNESSSYEWCGRGTYSSTGYGPDCEACGNNTYANIGETECHSCPDNMHAPAGAASLTECMCDDGYTSQWASGGPCYPIGGTPPQQGESNSTKSCSSYKSSDECNRDTSCQSMYGHTCKNDRWSFIGCQDKSTSGVCAPSVSNGNDTSSGNSSSSTGNSTCAVNSSGDRAWFATSCLPNGWTKAPVNKKCGSCCKPKNVPGGNGNVGGCTFANNSACVTLEYAGECPSLDVLNVWRIKVINVIAESVSSAMNVSKSDATIGITINVLPRTNQGTKSCEVRLQIFAPKTGSLTANDFIAAIWEQFNQNGDDLSAQSSSLSGIASYSTFGSLKPLDDVSDDVIINTSGAMTMATSSAAAVTIGIITIAALL